MNAPADPLAPRPPDALSPEHRRMLEVESGVAPGVVAARGYFTATKPVELKRLGFAESQLSVPTLVIPQFRPDGRLGGYQHRPDRPRVKDGRVIKYETRAKHRPVLDVSPAVDREQLRDPSFPLFITEGTRKGDALASVGLLAVALPGVDGWRGTNDAGGKTALPDWAELALNGRDAYLVFDSDVMVKKSVADALRRLKAYLESKGARVRPIYLPPGPQGQKQGADDFLVARSADLACPRVPVVGGDNDDESQRLARARVPIMELKRREWLRAELLYYAEADLRPSPEAAGETDETAAGPYRTSESGIIWRRESRDGVTSDVPLTNWEARIVREVEHDDGAETTRHYEVEAAARGRRRRFTVPAAQFAALNWVAEQLGAGALMDPGQGLRARVPHAIQTLSGDVPVETRYGHTGWREIGGRRYYLTVTGGVGEEGLRRDLAVHLSGAGAGYALPEPPSGAELADAVRASLAAVELAPDRVTVPVLGAAYRAVLGPCDVSVFLVGRTQVGKSEVAARAQQHFGAAMDARRLPANWSSTENALEGLLFAAKDALMVLDDFNPIGDAAGVGRWHAKADRVLRAQGNRQGRQRMRADGSLRPETPPRGLALATGEDLPRGESLRARLLVAEVSSGDVDPARLSRCQDDGASGRYAAAMAAFLRWLAPRVADVERDLPRLAARARDGWDGRSGAPPGGGSRHRLSRLSGNVAQIAVGWHVWLEFCAEVGALSLEEARDWRARVWRALSEVARAQPEHQAASDPARRYLQLVGAAIAARRVHLAGMEVEIPDEPERWGWRSQVSGFGEHERTEWRPQGHCIGYVERDAAGDGHLYLLPEPAFAAATGLARDNGEPLPIAETTLRRRLKEAGLLVSTDETRTRTTVRRTVRGNRPDLLHILAASLSCESPSQPSQPPPPPAEPAAATGDESPAGTPGWDGSPAPGAEPSHRNRPTGPEDEHDGSRVGPVGTVGTVFRDGETGKLRDPGSAPAPTPSGPAPVERGAAVDGTRFQERRDAGARRADAADLSRIAGARPDTTAEDYEHPGFAPKRIRRVLE